jgi:hypothetical protein
MDTPRSPLFPPLLRPWRATSEELTVTNRSADRVAWQQARVTVHIYGGRRTARAQSEQHGNWIWFRRQHTGMGSVFSTSPRPALDLIILSGSAPISLLQLQRLAERRGRVVSTPALYSGYLGFKPRSEDHCITEVSVIFLNSSRKVPGSCHKLGHSRFLPHPLKFYTTLSFDAIGYSLTY